MRPDHVRPFVFNISGLLRMSAWGLLRERQEFRDRENFVNEFIATHEVMFVFTRSFLRPDILDIPDRVDDADDKKESCQKAKGCNLGNLD